MKTGEFTWRGAYGKGAMKTHRENKRDEAEWRNERTTPGRRSTKRARNQRPHPHT